MADVASLQLKVDSEGVRTGQQRLEGLSSAAQQSEQSASGLRSGWQSFGQTITAINQGMQLAERVFGRVSGVVSDLRQHFEDNEQAAARVSAVIEATGGAAGLTADEVGRMATELSNATGIAGQTIQEAQAIGLSFKELGEEEFPRATEAAADMSTVMGQDMRQSMQQVAFAMNDPREGLTRLRRTGVQFTDTQREIINEFLEMGEIEEAQGVILEELESQFGGAAREMRDTARGSRMAYEEAIDGLKSVLGEGIEDLLRPGRERFIEWTQENLDTIGLLAENAPEVMDIMGRGIRASIEEIFSEEGLAHIGTTLIDVMSASAQTSAQAVVTILGTGFDSIVSMAETLGEDWAKVLINSWFETVQSGPRAFLRFIGIDTTAWTPFEGMDTSMADVAVSGLSTALAGLGEQFTQNLQNTGEQWDRLLSGLAGSTAESRAQIQDELSQLLEEARAAAEEQEESLAGAGGGEGRTGGIEDESSAIQNLIEQLERETELRDANREATVRYDTATMDATESERQEAIALAARIDEMEREEEMRQRAEQVLRDLMTPMDEYREAREELAELERAGLLTDDQHAEALENLRDEFDKSSDDAEKFADALDRIAENAAWNAIETGVNSFGDLGQSIIESEDAMAGAQEVAKEFAFALLDMLPGVLLSIAKAAAEDGNWALAIGLVAAAAGTSVSTGIMKGIDEQENANGNVYDSGGVVPFASGGVVTQPTTFPFKNGVGLMGEAGPEAIMPLQRTASGDLGVRSSGGGGGDNNVNVSVHNYSGEKVERRERQNGNSRDIELIIGQNVDRHMASGRGDGAMKSNFGVRRNPR